MPDERAVTPDDGDPVGAIELPSDGAPTTASSPVEPSPTSSPPSEPSSSPDGFPEPSELLEPLESPELFELFELFELLELLAEFEELDELLFDNTAKGLETPVQMGETLGKTIGNQEGAAG
jgi:hypothetical protein